MVTRRLGDITIVERCKHIIYKIEDEMTSRKKKSKTEDIIPEEINDHLKLFGKEPWEVDYNKFGRCEMCGSE